MHEDPATNDDLYDAELDDKLDANLLEIEILYKSRCVSTRDSSNVTVREIERPDK